MCVIFFFFKQKTAYEMLRSLVGSEMCIRDRKSLARESMGTTQHTLCCVRHLVRACVDYIASECNSHLDRFKKLTTQATSIAQIERASQEMSGSVRRTLFLTDDNLRLSDAFGSLVSCMLRSVLDDNSADIDAVSYTHLRAHETPEHLVCRLLLEKKKNNTHPKN
eukprot:TRINITY_DN18481_c0_g1_i3.p1 TRINITY_DN18481_c0_g1~~TRINITY_DN18481_c0_g1_i3.p1  ORF type:complete len:165 (-),score=30.04 TRINITY_DN18481_c0_g1_i3:35-529(-)